MTDTTPMLTEKAMREAFEVFAEHAKFPTYKFVGTPTMYINESTEFAWSAWQESARIAEAATKAVVTLRAHTVKLESALEDKDAAFVSSRVLRAEEEIATLRAQLSEARADIAELEAGFLPIRATSAKAAEIAALKAVPPDAELDHLTSELRRQNWGILSNKAANAISSLRRRLTESESRLSHYSGDCYICHHDAEHSLICSRCSPKCVQCRANRAEAERDALRKDAERWRQLLVEWQRCFDHMDVLHRQHGATREQFIAGRDRLFAAQAEIRTAIAAAPKGEER